MNKKDLRMYETPAVEIIEMDVQGMLCASFGGGEFEEQPEI